jgi:hypothetical protein
VPGVRCQGVQKNCHCLLLTAYCLIQVPGAGYGIRDKRGTGLGVKSRRPQGRRSATFAIDTAQSRTAVASISIRNSGTARAETPIQVLAGGFP